MWKPDGKSQIWIKVEIKLKLIGKKHQQQNTFVFSENALSSDIQFQNDDFQSSCKDFLPPAKSWFKIYDKKQRSMRVVCIIKPLQTRTESSKHTKTQTISKNTCFFLCLVAVSLYSYCQNSLAIFSWVATTVRPSLISTICRIIWIETKNCLCENQVLFSKINVCHCLLFWTLQIFAMCGLHIRASFRRPLLLWTFNPNIEGFVSLIRDMFPSFSFHFISRFTSFVLECLWNLFRNRWNFCCFFWMYVAQRFPECWSYMWKNILKMISNLISLFAH